MKVIPPLLLSFPTLYAVELSEPDKVSLVFAKVLEGFDNSMQSENTQSKVNAGPSKTLVKTLSFLSEVNSDLG
jgi:hypothetical protein